MKKLPETWYVKKLTDVILSLESGSRPKEGVLETGEIPSLGAEHLDNNGKIKSKYNKFISIDYYKSMKRGKVAKEDLLLVKDGATTGKISYIDESVPYDKIAINEHLFSISPNQNLVKSKYLFYYLFTENGYQQIMQDFRGATVGGISRNFTEFVQVPLPPLPQQEKIVSVLDTAHALVEKQKVLLEKYDLFLKSKFIEMFGDPVKNPMGWEKVLLGDLIVSAKDGPHVSPDYSDTGVPFLSTRHVKPNVIVWDDLKYVSKEIAQVHWKKCKPERGDILYTKGGTTGVAAKVNTDIEFAVWVHVALLKIKHEIVNSTWLERMLNSSFCYAQSQHLTRGIVNRDLGLKQMVKISMYYPPLELQEKYSLIVKQVETLKQKEQQKLEKLQTLYNALMKRAFDGEIG